MKIMAHTGGLASTNCYLIADEQAKVAVLFDAPDHTVAPLLQQTHRQGWDLIGLWLTHGHFDHLADHQLVREQFPNVKLLIHERDEPKLRQPGSRLFQLPFTIPPGQPDGHVRDGQQLSIGSIEVRVIETPGHAPGHVCYHLPGFDLLIGGDLIIGGAIGRTDLPDSSEHQLAQSVRRVMQLPGRTQLLGGHGPASSLEHERENNPYVRAILDHRWPRG